jgi:MoaA/NifB/PqqE/SkfB family radical SAM enzyme
MSFSKLLGRGFASLEYAAREHVPLFVTLELGLGCNLKCRHCYNFDRQAEPPKAERPPLAPEEILRVIDELAEAGTLSLTFTGGEALLHPHLLELIRHAKGRRLFVQLKSNGMLLTPERARLLRQAGAGGIAISLYGASSGTHDFITSVPGSFGKTVAGVKAASAAGLCPEISFILHGRNSSELDAMISLAGELGATHTFSTAITSRYDGTDSSRELGMTDAQFEELTRGKHGELFLETNDSGEVRCPCATYVCGISSTGLVYPCIGAPIPSGDLRAKAFREIWTGSSELNRIRGLELEDFKSCAPCADRPYCSRSSGAVYCNTGDYTGKDDEDCRRARIRANALGH